LNRWKVDIITVDLPSDFYERGCEAVLITRSIVFNLNLSPIHGDFDVAAGGELPSGGRGSVAHSANVESVFFTVCLDDEWIQRVIQLERP
jgi:hypothetical protein